MIEIILVLSIFSILTSFVTINLLRPQNKASVDSISTQLVADIKNQQIKSMVGDTEGQNTPQQFGVYFEQDGYTLFRGAAYNNSEPSNFKVTLEGDLAIGNITFGANQIIFEKISGNVAGFTPGSNSLTISHASSGVTETVIINSLGAITTN